MICCVQNIGKIGVDNRVGNLFITVRIIVGPDQSTLTSGVSLQFSVSGSLDLGLNNSVFQCFKESTLFLNQLEKPPAFFGNLFSKLLNVVRTRCRVINLTKMCFFSNDMMNVAGNTG